MSLRNGDKQIGADRKLVGKTRIGDFVHETQEMAHEDGFDHVAKKWLDGTFPIEQELQRLAETSHERETVYCDACKLVPANLEGRFVLRDERGRELIPDDLSIGHLGARLGIGASYVRTLFENNDDESRTMLELVLEHARQRATSSAQCQLKIEKGSRLRAVLSPGHSHLRGAAYLGILARAVPGGRISHWRGDEYAISGNVLIPDTIREEADSDYGGMISIANCELGNKSFLQRPSIFRAICRNGCIWDQEESSNIRLNRLGMIEPNELEKVLAAHIHEQIPLIDVGLKTMLGTRSFETKSPIKPLFAQICKDRRISRDLASSVLNAWFEEKKAVPDLSKTLFSVINSFTRAGQRHSNETWVRFDEIGGQLSQMKRDDWDSLVSRASKLPQRKVESAFGGFVAETTTSTIA